MILRSRATARRGLVLICLAVLTSTSIGAASVVAAPGGRGKGNGPKPAPAVAAVPKVVDGAVDDWVGTSSFVAGTTQVSGAEFVYQDFVYDDTGAAAATRTANAGRGNGAQTFGTYRYPTAMARYRSNAADLFQFRAARDGDRVTFLVWLNTLVEPDTTVVGIAVGSPSTTQRKPWPLGARLATPSDHVLTVWGTGGLWDDAPLAEVGGAVAVDTDANAIEVSVPLALVGSRFRAYVATGLWSGAGWMDVQGTRSATAPGGGDGVTPNAFNVAFRHGETDVDAAQAWQDGNFWFEREQAAALASADIDDYYADIDLDALDTPAPPPVGLNQIIHRAGATPEPHEGFIEHGVSANNEDPLNAGRGRGCSLATPPLVSCTAFALAGPWQPYAAYVPPGGYERMVVLLHGGTYPLNYTLVRKIQQQLGDETRSVLVEPVALGPSSWYTDEAHLEVITSMRDAQLRFAVDPSRTIVGGISMGGYGTNRLLVTNPDLFAAGILWSAAVGDTTHDYGGNRYEDVPAEGNGNPVDLQESNRNHRLQIIHAHGDQSALFALVVPQTRKLDEMGYAYELLGHPTWQHTSVFTANDWRRERDFILSVGGDSNPARVSFATSEAWWRPAISPDLVFDRAYWVSGIRVRDTQGGLASKGVVDATTRGLAKAEPHTEPIPEAVFSGPPAPHTRSGRQLVAPSGAGPAAENRFTAALTNVRLVSFDLDRMGLRAAAPFRAAVTSDGPVELRLLGGAALAPALTGAATYVDGRDLVVVLTEAGTFELRAGEGDPPPPPPPVRGPAGLVADCATASDPGALSFQPVPPGSGSPTEVSTGDNKARAASPSTNSYYVVELGGGEVRSWGRRDGNTTAGEPEQLEAHDVTIGADPHVCAASPAAGAGMQGP